MLQEREKRRIVIASVLKPVDDTRMTEKIGQSLVDCGLYAVSVIGYCPSGTTPENIECISLGRFTRISVARYLARWRAFSIAFRRKPDVFIFGTYELIFPAILLKVILGTRIIYDVRENYYRNIHHSEALPFLLRFPLALTVRLVEKVTAPAIDHFILAERGYEDEFRFHRGGWTVLENKAMPSQATARRWKKGEPLHLLFSGTLSESTGVFRAIDLVAKIHQHVPDVRLTIAGYAASPAVRRRIQEAASSHSFVALIGIDQLVPHSKILSLISGSHAGIIAYLHLPQTQNTVPTKLFEYLQASLPILTEKHWTWADRYEQCRPFVFTNFETPDIDLIINQLSNSSLYPIPAPDTGWNTEVTKLLEIIKLVV